MITRWCAVVAMLGMLGMITENASAQTDASLYELRVYTPESGRQSDTLKLIGGDASKMMTKHQIQLVGAWVPLDSADERVVTLVRHKDRPAADAAWAAFQNDDEWKKALKGSEVDGKKPVQSIAKVFLTPNDYSPKLDVKAVGDRVFELRTYIATPNNLPLLNDRFRNHTLKLFEKHGMTNIIYWSVAKEEPMTAAKLLEAVSPVGGGSADIDGSIKGVDNALVYFITHKSKEAAAKSFGAFVQDEEWKKARSESESKGGGSLTAGNAVKSWYLKPTDFSPLK